jgi:HEAT repeat protein
LLKTVVDADDHVDAAQDLKELVGTQTINALLSQLQSTTDMGERQNVIQMLRQYGGQHLPNLLEELKSPDTPWFAQRNLLNVLAALGDPSAFSVVRTKLHHVDPRIRSEALVTAVQLLGEKAAPDLLHAMADSHPSVVSRAVSLAGQCRTPDVLKRLIVMLNPPPFSHPHDEDMQLSVCLALSQFTDKAARRQFEQIVYPPFVSTLRTRSEKLRSVAITALAKYLMNADTLRVVQRALKDRSPLVRQTAQRVLAENAVVA